MKPGPLRSFCALLATAAVLFSQLAVAAYACPGQDGMRQLAPVAEEAPPCDQHSSREAPPTPLCKAHCQQGDQSLDQRGAPLPGVGMVALPVSWLPAKAAVETVPQAPDTQSSLLERPTGPPLAVRHCCFRI